MEDKTCKGSKNRLLIVDDRIEQRAVIKCLLEFSGFECIEAENGQNAIELYQSNSDIGVILMDMKMPVIDGFEATKFIRKWEKINNISPVPIIAVTAYALNDERNRVLEAGCNKHITKPFTQSMLKQAIAEVLESSISNVS